ncbi:MAG: hypothetical protein O2955_16325 [Planctomycetota bacterium]|nr:hypothetical protein [Planctomycetota bacterium]MDA1214079.1 hypothetical protein [Planctomycetota bacterium]
MSLGPILPGRLPTSLLTSRLAQNIQASSLSLARVQDQISSGKKYFLPSENPTSSIRALILQKSLESRKQIQANIVTDRTFLANSESTLAPVSDLLNRAKGALQAGLGDASTAVERTALANEVVSMLQGALGIANASFQGRYLFAGTQNSQPPFQLINGAVRYLGDGGAINSFVDAGTLVANNVDGATAFGALKANTGSDINPALTTSTRIGDLLAGRGITLGKIELTLDDGVNPIQSAVVDLTSAQTIGDIKTRLENAFAGGPVTLGVDIDPTSKMGLRLTPSAGSIAVRDITGSTVARDLGILGGPAASIVGDDLDPALSIYTSVSALNGGTGIGSTAGTGLLIDNGLTSKVVDLSSANTVQDIFNTLRQSGLDLVVGFNSERNGLAISSRLSGKQLTIGENGGTNASGLGIRTMTPDTFLADLNFGAGVLQDGSESIRILRRDGTNVDVDIGNAVTIRDVIDAINAVDEFSGSTPLADLNLGTGVPVGGGSQLDITRRDGSNVSIDLSGTSTLQEVVDAINAVDAGNLVASIDATNHRLTLTDNSGIGDLTVATNDISTALGMAGSETSGDTAAALTGVYVPVKLFARFNTFGNGIEIADGSGSGPLTIDSNTVAIALGIDGTQSGSDPTAFLAGRDVNGQKNGGVFGILLELEQALRKGDNQTMSRLEAELTAEIDRFNAVRAETGSRMKLLDDVESRLLDDNLQIQEALSKETDTDITEAILQMTQQQATFETTLKVAAQTFSLNLLNFI